MISFSARFGPWAVVAGSAQGLGAEFAGQLAARRLNLVLVDRLAKELRQLAGRLAPSGVKIRPVVADLATSDALSVIRRSTDDIEVGLLVFNAARSVIGPFLSRSIEDHLQSVDINCRAPAALAHHFGRRLAEHRRGGIVLMSSLSAFHGAPMVAHYAATKAYNLVLAEGLADELAPFGVSVLGVCPGPTRTPGYLASSPARAGRILAKEMEPSEPVAEALRLLEESPAGARPVLIPGLVNRGFGFVLQRLLPRKWATAVVGAATRRMFASTGWRQES